MSKYVIAAPSHSDEVFIERTIQSMVDQTVPPMKGITVNDGSADRIGEIASFENSYVWYLWNI